MVAGILIVNALVSWGIYAKTNNLVWADWTGFGDFTSPSDNYFRGKTLWDWLPILIGLLVFEQFFLQRKEQKRQAVFRLLDELATLEFRRRIRFIYSREPEDLVRDKLTVEDNDSVEEITGKFEGIGFRIRKGFIPKKLAIELIWDMELRCGQRLYLHVKDQQNKRKDSGMREDLRYRNDFLWLTRECKNYHLKQLGYNIADYSSLTLDQLLAKQPLYICDFESINDNSPEENGQTEEAISIET